MGDDDNEGSGPDSLYVPIAPEVLAKVAAKAAAASAPVKRGRGRPRKNRTPENLMAGPSGTLRRAKAQDRYAQAQDRATRERAAQRRLRALGGDMEPIIDQQIRLVEYQQQTLANEITQGAGAAQKFITSEDMNKLANLTRTVEKLGDLKIRWLAAAQKFGASLTPAQVVEGAMARISALPREQCLKVIRRLYDEYNARLPGGAWVAGSKLIEATTAYDPVKPVTDDLATLLGG